MTTIPRLLSVATAVPPIALRQPDVQRRLCTIFRERATEAERFLPVFDNAGIETRYSCVPLDWYEDNHGWSDRNPLYLANATTLLREAAERALAAAGLQPSEIDGIVCVSTSGIATPSLDALLMQQMDFRCDVFRLPVFGLGCAGGVIGLARAARLAQAAPEERILFLVVEPCALTLCRNDYSKSNIIATALFGDGAAAAVVSCRGHGPSITAAGEHTWPALSRESWPTSLRWVASADAAGLLMPVTNSRRVRSSTQCGSICVFSLASETSKMCWPNVDWTSATRRSAAGLRSSAPHTRSGSGLDVPNRSDVGTWTKCSSQLVVGRCTCGAQSMPKERCWTSWSNDTATSAPRSSFYASY